MPEGHVSHRAVRFHGRCFAGRSVEVMSPQGRFADAAAVVNGSLLERVQAHGKHIFYSFDSGQVIHVHLGLVGKFRLWSAPFGDLSPNARLVLTTDEHRLQLTGPNTCELISVDGVNRILDRLGPDPLAQRPGDNNRFADGLSRRRVPIVRALLDQKVIAGLGNVFRSELCFLSGLAPDMPANKLDSAQVAALWDLSVSQLAAAERQGNIVTVTAEEADGDGRHYVYQRGGLPCLRCLTVIEETKPDTRRVWWCPQCQRG